MQRQALTSVGELDFLCCCILRDSKYLIVAQLLLFFTILHGVALQLLCREAGRTKESRPLFPGSVWQKSGSMWLLLLLGLIVLLIVWKGRAKDLSPAKLTKYYEGKVVWVTGGASGLGEGK